MIPSVLLYASIGACLFQYQIKRSHLGAPNAVRALLSASNGNILVVGTASGDVALWDVRNITANPRLTEWVKLAVAKDKSKAAVAVGPVVEPPPASAESLLQGPDATNPEPTLRAVMQFFGAHPSPAHTYAGSTSGIHDYAGIEAQEKADPSLRPDVMVLGTFRRSGNASVGVSSLAMGKNGTVVTAYDDGKVIAWDSRNVAPNAVVTEASAKWAITVGQAVKVVAVNSKGTMLFVGGTLGEGATESSEVGGLVSAMDPQMQAESDAIGADLASLLQRSEPAEGADPPGNGFVRSFDLSTLPPTERMSHSLGNCVSAMCVSPDGSTVFAGGDDGTLAAFGTDSPYPVLKEKKMEASKILTLTYNSGTPEANTSHELYVGGSSSEGGGFVKTFSIPMFKNGGGAAHMVEKPGLEVRVGEEIKSITLDPGFRWMYAAGWLGVPDQDPNVDPDANPADPGMVNVYDVRKGLVESGGNYAHVGGFGAKAWVNDMSVTPDGRFLFGGHDDGSLSVWYLPARNLPDGEAKLASYGGGKWDFPVRSAEDEEEEALLNLRSQITVAVAPDGSTQPVHQPVRAAH